MKAMWLLGAGASRDAGLPDANGLTEKLLERAADREFIGGKELLPLLRFVCGAILFQKAQVGQDPTQTRVNVEALFNAVQFLNQRSKWDYLPLVNGFHPMIESLAYQTQAGPTSYDRSRAIDQIVEASFNLVVPDAFGKRLVKNERAVSSLKSGLNYLTANHNERKVDLVEQTMEWMIAQLDVLLWVDEKTPVDYLLPVVTGNPDTPIVSLNYDRCVEEAARRKGVAVRSGIEAWKPGSYQNTEGVQPLLKLHGSIDWHYGGKDETIEVDRIVVAPPEHPRSRRLGGPSYGLGEGRSERRALIFGGANKLTVKGPFLDLLSGFQHRLSETTRLVVVGYSFSDEHINHQIKLWLTSKDCEMCVINGPSFKVEQCVEPLIYDRSNLRYHMDRFGSVSSPFGDQIRVIPQTASAGIPIAKEWIDRGIAPLSASERIRPSEETE